MAGDTALLVIDVQNGLFDEGAYEPERLLTHVKTLIDHARSSDVELFQTMRRAACHAWRLSFGGTKPPIDAPLVGHRFVHKIGQIGIVLLQRVTGTDRMRRIGWSGILPGGIKIGQHSRRPIAGRRIDHACAAPLPILGCLFEKCIDPLAEAFI